MTERVKYSDELAFLQEICGSIGSSRTTKRYKNISTGSYEDTSYVYDVFQRVFKNMLKKPLIIIDDGSNNTKYFISGNLKGFFQGGYEVVFVDVPEDRSEITSLIEKIQAHMIEECSEDIIENDDDDA
jgi:hypothetical protein